MFQSYCSSSIYLFNIVNNGTTRSIKCPDSLIRAWNAATIFNKYRMSRQLT